MLAKGLLKSRKENEAVSQDWILGCESSTKYSTSFVRQVESCVDVRFFILGCLQRRGVEEQKDEGNVQKNGNYKRTKTGNSRQPATKPIKTSRQYKESVGKKPDK